jgi:hypothetical protein
MAWRVARSLNILLGQLNALAPRRSKISDGSIGDTAHASRDSDHNPWYGPGIVTARDFTHDIAGGLNCHNLAAILISYRDPRIKYIIWNGRIVSGNGGPSPWQWRPYSGVNPHTKHLHVSVVAGPACDNVAPWAGIGSAPPQPKDKDVDLNDPMRPFIWPHTAEIKDTVGSTLANAYSYAKGAEAAALRMEARLAAVSNQLTDNQAILLAAISDDETQVTLSPEQMQLLLAGVSDATARGLFEALKAKYEPQEGGA